MNEKMYVICYYMYGKFLNEVIKCQDYKTALAYALQKYIGNFVSIVEVPEKTQELIVKGKFTRDENTGELSYEEYKTN